MQKLSDLWWQTIVAFSFTLRYIVALKGGLARLRCLPAATTHRACLTRFHVLYVSDCFQAAQIWAGVIGSYTPSMRPIVIAGRMGEMGAVTSNFPLSTY